MNNNMTQYNLDFGTKPTTEIPIEPEVLNINPDIILKDYAKAYVEELQRRNPLKFKSMVDSYESEDDFLTRLYNYFQGLLKIRIDSVHDRCRVWRQAKQLVVPAWIQFILTEIGRFVDYEYGLYIMPEFEFNLDIEEMLSFSHILESFKNDGVSLFKDAIPRSKDGDREVMSMAIVGDFVKSITKDAHPIASYVVAFLGAKLSEESALNCLYRVRYDDIAFIKAMLISEGTIY